MTVSDYLLATEPYVAQILAESAVANLAGKMRDVPGVSDVTTTRIGETSGNPWPTYTYSILVTFDDNSDFSERTTVWWTATADYDKPQDTYFASINKDSMLVNNKEPTR